MSDVHVVFASLDGVGTLDVLRVPNSDLSAVLQPTCLSTFTAINGTSLDAITPEVGGAWTEQDGNWDIQTNRAGLSATSANRDIATVDAGMADAMVDCVVNLTGAYAGLALRYTDTNNSWNLLLNQSPDQLELYEINGDVVTLRASAAVVLGAGIDYDVRAICYGNTIDGFVDGGNKLSYGSASFNNTVTLFGVRSENTGDTLENFAVYPRTAAVYDEELDRC